MKIKSISIGIIPLSILLFFAGCDWCSCSSKKELKSEPTTTQHESMPTNPAPITQEPKASMPITPMPTPQTPKAATPMPTTPRMPVPINPMPKA